MTTMTNENTASQRQIDFINRLKAERHWYEYDPENIADNIVRAQDEPAAYAAGVNLAVARQMWRDGQFTKAMASSVIEVLLAAPEKPKDAAPQPEVVETPTAGPATEGMHQVGDTIYKVQKAVHGSGRLYAKVLKRDGVGSDWRFAYAPGAMKNLSAATAMTIEQAKAFGVLYGQCCVCGRTLTNEDSIEAGIGPVCADKF